MNLNLREEIVKHILSNFGIINSDFIDYEKTKSLMSKEYLLNEILVFEDENKVHHNKIWGCQLSSEAQELKILLGDCTQYEDIPEFCLIVQLKNAPGYGLYFTYNSLINKELKNECMISFSVGENKWSECGNYLQATFLAGMEQAKDIGFGWNKCQNYQSQYQLMLSFIKYYSSIYEENQI